MKVRLAPWLFISGVALAASAHAGEQAAPAQSSDETTATAEFNGMKVAVDKKTGKLRPLTPAESRELDEMLTQQGRSSARRGLPAPPATEAAAIATARSLPMGGTAMKLPESQMEYLTATRDADGNLVLSHSSDVGATEELPHE
jgi:hypothetical protein